MTGRAEIVNSVHTGGQGGIYGGNPVACAAALAAAAARCWPSNSTSRARWSRTPQPRSPSPAPVHRAGLVTLACGTCGNVIRLLPPLVIGDELLDEGLTIIMADAFAGSCP